MGNRNLRNIRPSGSFLTGSDVMKRHPVVTEGVVEGVCAYATGRCAMSALVGPFPRKCPLGCSIGKKSKLNSEKILKIQKKSKLNSEKIWKLWKKSKLKCEKI